MHESGNTLGKKERENKKGAVRGHPGYSSLTFISLPSQYHALHIQKQKHNIGM